jgi:hypothetical protein
MGQAQNPPQTHQSSMRCLGLLRLGNCHPSVNTPHNQPCQMEMVQSILLYPLSQTNSGISITLQRLFQLETRHFHSPLQRDHLHASLRFPDMDRHPNPQMTLFVENCLRLAEDISTSMQTVIEDFPKPTVHNIQALAIIAVATRKLQVRTNQALLQRQWRLTG